MLPLYQQRNCYNNMADVNKSKLQLRSSLSINGDKTPSQATKLLINHGKPNFTIQRSPRTQNGNVNPMSPTPEETCHVQNNNNEFVVKSTTFNGVFKPSNISVAAKQILPKNANTINNDTENEATKVVLRRPKFVQTEMRGQDDENVPEFIRRQRRIQERLANQNILDFENRRSGYFTQVLISPSSPNRQSFVETMTSPAVKPGLEIPLPPTEHEDIKEATTVKEQQHEQRQQPEVEEEEVAKAIEEVNKAVEGEDDDKAELEYAKSSQEESEQNTESTIVAVNTIEYTEETKPENEEKQQGTAALDKPFLEDTLVAAASGAEETEHQNGHVEAEFTRISGPLVEEKIELPELNNLVEQHLQNGHFNGKTLENGITISHTNGLSNSILPTPDPKGEKSVNIETKTVVSFSQELGNGDNKYPDIVRVVNDFGSSEVDSELKALTKLKFEIKANNRDIEIKPIITTETA